MQFVRKPRRQPVINIISLIDILIVLLIFYIATTVFKKSEPKIKIIVPSSTRATTTPNETLPSIIYVTEDSKIFLDDAPVDPDKLGDLLKSKLAANPDFKVAMKADTKAPFGVIVQVMDAAFWVKGCSSLGLKRYAVLLRIGDKGKGAEYCLMDIKEAVPALAPQYKNEELPKDEAERVWTDAGRSATDTTLLKATRQRLHAAN